MSADTDYARILDLLSKQRLPAYVAYDTRDRINGLGADDQRDHIVVRVRDGKIVAGSSHVSVKADSAKYAENSNPVSNPLFDAKCYRATGERRTSFKGRDVLELTLQPTCAQAHPGDHKYPFTTMYADPRSLAPIEVTGTPSSSEDSKNVTVSLDQQFTEVDGRIMPSSIKVDVSGTGIMFWLQVHVDESYANYQFLNSYRR